MASNQFSTNYFYPSGSL